MLLGEKNGGMSPIKIVVLESTWGSKFGELRNNHGRRTIKNGGLSIRTGGITVNTGGLTNKHGDLTIKNDGLQSMMGS